MTKIGLKELDLDGKRVFALACASRVGGVVRYFGTSQAKAAFDKVIARLWCLAIEGSLDGEQLQTDILNTPDAEIDDCYRRGYYAMRSLGVLVDAIEAFQSDSEQGVEDAAQAAADGVCSLAADIFYIAGEQQDMLINETKEMKFQSKVIDLAMAKAKNWKRRVENLCVTQSWPEHEFSAIDVAHGWVKR